MERATRMLEQPAIIRDKESKLRVGTVLKSSLSNDAQGELQEALHGEGSSQ
jgi:hypothetical protein